MRKIVEEQSKYSRTTAHMDTLVYVVFIKPKTQREAVKILYNDTYDNVNMEPFRNARRRLQQRGMLESDGKMRNAVFESVGDFEDREKYSREYLEGSDIFKRDEFGNLNFDWNFLANSVLNELKSGLTDKDSTNGDRE